MIVNFNTMRPVRTVPHREVSDFWRRKIAPADQAAIKAAINEEIEGSTIACSSFIPGADWTSTAYQSIYVALGDERLAAMCFGLLVWVVFMETP